MALTNDFEHPIKKDKNGNNPAKLLLKVLYKHLIQLVQHNAFDSFSLTDGKVYDKEMKNNEKIRYYNNVLVDEGMRKELRFDQLIN